MSSNLPREHRQKALFRLSVLIAMAVVLTLVVAGILWLVYRLVFANPVRILDKSFKKLAELESLQLDGESLSSKSWFRAKLHLKNNELSYLEGHFNVELENKPEPVDVYLITNPFEAYLKVKYGPAQELQKKFLTENPLAVRSESFLAIRPVLLGEKWIYIEDLEHYRSPRDAKTATPASPSPGGTTLTSAELKIWQDLFLAVKVRSFNHFYRYEGQRHTRFVLGLDKKRVISALDQAAELSVEKADKKRLQRLAAAVEKTETLDVDLIEVIINRDNYPVMVKVNLPVLPDDAIKGFLNATSGDEDQLVPLNIQTAVIKQYHRLEKRKPAEAVAIPLFAIKLSEFNQVGEIKRPEPFVKFESLMTQAEREFGPAVKLFRQSLEPGGRTSGEPASLPPLPESVTPYVTP